LYLYYFLFFLYSHAATISGTSVLYRGGFAQVQVYMFVPNLFSPPAPVLPLEEYMMIEPSTNKYTT